jgi:HEAT repeat protein
MHGWKRFFNSIPGNLEQSNYRIFEPNNPDGKAEIFHWFSRDDIPKVTKDEFIEALINFETGFDNNYENFYRYRAYFLAAEALSYFPDSRFGDEIVNQLLKWSYVYFGWQIIPSPLKKAARETLKITDRNRVIAAFTQLLHSTTSRVTLRHAAVELGKFDPGNKTAIAALILLLDVTQDDYLQWKIVRQLADISHGNEHAISTLIYIIETTEDKSICRSAIMSLGDTAFAHATAISALIRFLKINQGDEICLDAVQALQKIDPGNKAVMNTLIFLLENTQNLQTFPDCLGFSYQIEPGNMIVLSVLLERLESSQCEYLCCHAAGYLAKYNPENEVAKNALFNILENGKTSAIFRAAQYLVKIVPNNEHLIYSICQQLEVEKDEYIVDMLVECLIELTQTNTNAITALISMIETTSNQVTLWKLICGFRRLEFDHQSVKSKRQEIIAVLTRLLHKSQDDDYVSIAQTLWRINPENEMAVETIAKIAEVNDSDWIVWQAAEILLQTEKYYQNSVSILQKRALTNTLGYNDHFVSYELQQITKKVQNKPKALNSVIQIYLFVIHNCEELEDKPNLNPCQIFQYDLKLLEISEQFQEIIKPEYFPDVIKSLKQYLDEKSYKNTSYRYEAVYNLIWYCAQNMNYLDFYNNYT